MGAAANPAANWQRTSGQLAQPFPVIGTPPAPLFYHIARRVRLLLVRLPSQGTPKLTGSGGLPTPRLARPLLIGT